MMRFVYVVDDDLVMVELIWVLLIVYGVEIRVFYFVEEFFKEGDIEEIGCFILDVCFFGISGFDLFDLFNEWGFFGLFVLVSGYVDVDIFVWVW